MPADSGRLEQLGATIEPILRATRIPGIAIAIVLDGKMVFARGFGHRDAHSKAPMTSDTVYPIASTTKALNATLVGMLVDEGKLAWDAPVQTYLPTFRLGDVAMSAQVSLRDLLAMRTGLPRHDWVWIENPISRAQLVAGLRHLELSASFREKFQYNNMTATTAGHIAELVTGQSWEELIKQRLLEPLGMSRTGFDNRATGPVTSSYLENDDRQLVSPPRTAGEVTAPSGGAIHSTVEDMARWALFNLQGGKVGERQLIQPQTLKEIHAPQVPARSDPSCPTPHAAYAMGWFVDVYNRHSRLSHGGYLHNVNSDVSLFPEDGVGIVSFSNFGPALSAKLVNQYVFDLLMGLQPVETVEEKLALYEKKLAENLERIRGTRRVTDTAPSHPLESYTGRYAHPSYGTFIIEQEGEELVLKRGNLTLPLEHWHHDAWVAKASEHFIIHIAHGLDRTSRLLFETNADGEIAALAVRLEPSVAAIRLEKQ